MQSCNRDDMSDHSDISQNLSGFGTSSITRFVPEPEGFDKKSYLPSPFNSTYPSGNLSGHDSPGIALWMKTREDILKYSREKNNALGLEYSRMCNFLRTSDAYVDSSVPPSHNKNLEAILIGERPDTPKMAYSSDFGIFFQDNINSDNNQEEEQIPLDDFPPSPSDHQSILVSLSTRCVWKGTVCERAHLFRIKYYGSFDKPLGRFLRDHLFDQGYRCRFCEMPSEAHVHCYTHRQGSLTISVKKLPEFLLPGEKDGKIWMWHRCLRCPRRGGIPPETRRVVMSDAAWGLSFGKFLELSFSNHAAASRVASCGHSLHRDCLRFYGFGKMVACFRYASINVHSVFLPPAQLDFSAQSADWIQNEVDEVTEKAHILFTEAFNGINQVSERISAIFPNAQLSKFPGSKLCTVDLRGLWLKEKADFEDSLLKISENDSKKGQPDIIEINKLRRRLLFHAYLWDRRLIVSAGFENNSNEGLGRIPMNKEKLIIEEPVESDSPLKPNSFGTNVDSSLVDGIGDAVLKESPLVASTEGGFLSHSDVNSSNNQKGEVTYNSSYTEEGQFHISCLGTDSKKEDPLDSDVLVHKTLSDGEVLLVQNLSETLDAKWTGENGMIHDLSCPDLSAPTDDKNVIVEPFDSMVICGKPDLVRSLSAVPSGEGIKRDLSRWVEMPFSNFYHAINKGYASNIPLFHILNEYNPTYIFSFRELNRQGGAKVLLSLGVDEIFIPIFEDEPTSIICHALVSPDYHFLMSDERDKIKDGGDSTISLPYYDSGSFNHLPSFDEISSESLRSIGSAEDSVLSILTSNTLPLDPGPHSKNLHIKVSFSDDGSLGKTKYSVTCYYAKHFQSLRRICCPSELDFIKSISRCKKWGAQGGKSNVFFAKSLDDRFIIKQVTKTELDSFLQFAPRYFKYLSDSIKTRSPTCLAKILGIYQVSSKNLKGGKESKMDVLVMENLLYGRNISRLYDLKGSSRSRYNADSSGNNKVLLDQNLIESMPTSPIFVGNKAKRLLERAVWNDTSFLANIDVMDYSLLVGVDDERYELVLGIIDFMRQYTWDKHLETWVKASGILGGPKNAAPTVISPKQYKKRFRKAMTAYFLMVPDQWSPSSIAPSRSQSDFGEDA